MDERHGQIKEGAGLEESRLNVEFIEWLRKWSTPILIVVAVVAGLYVLSKRFEEAEIRKVNAAFQEFEAASVGTLPSPEALERVANDFSGVRGIPHMARLSAADAYRTAVIVGYVPGAELNDDGSLVDEADALTDEDREQFLTNAERLYQGVLDDVKNRKSMAVLHALGAPFGLATVEECRANYEGAKSYYEKARVAAESALMPEMVALADKRIADLASMPEPPVLYRAAVLPKKPEPEIPEPTTLPLNITDPGTPADGADGPATDPDDGAPAGGDEPTPPAAGDGLVADDGAGTTGGDGGGR